jgi:hypothetical protein
MNLPDLSNPAVFVGLGPLGLGYILEAGGSGYFRQRSVQPHLDAGRLRLVPRAPEFIHPAYAVYSANADDRLLGSALEGLRHIALSESERP